MAITVTLLISTWYPVNVFKMTLLVIHFSFVLKLYQPSKAHPQVNYYVEISRSDQWYLKIDIIIYQPP